MAYMRLDAVPENRYLCDTLEDLQTIPNLHYGDKCFVISENCDYICNSKKEWNKVPAKDMDLLKAYVDQKVPSDGPRMATEDYVREKIADLIDGAPATLDTLKEIADAIQGNETLIETLNQAINANAKVQQLTQEEYANIEVDPTALYLLKDENSNYARLEYNHINYNFTPVAWEEGEYDYSFWTSKSALPPRPFFCDLNQDMIQGQKFNKRDYYFDNNYPLIVGETVKVQVFSQLQPYTAVVRKGPAPVDFTYVGNAALYDPSWPNTGESFFFGHLDPLIYDAPIFAKRGNMPAPGQCAIICKRPQIYSPSDTIQIVENQGVLNVSGDVVIGYPENDSHASLARIGKTVKELEKGVQLINLDDNSYWDLTEEEQQANAIYISDPNGESYFKGRPIGSTFFYVDNLQEAAYYSQDAYRNIAADGVYLLDRTIRNPIYADLENQDTIGVTVCSRTYTNLVIDEHPTYGLVVGNYSLLDANYNDTGEDFVIYHIGEPTMTLKTTSGKAPGWINLHRTERCIRDWNDQFGFCESGKLYVPETRPNQPADIILGDVSVQNTIKALTQRIADLETRLAALENG